MADSDRSRSPVPMRNRLDPRGQVPAQPLPFFPLRCGPMSASVRHFQNMPRLQNRPNWSANSSGLTSWNVCGHHHHISTVSTNSTNHSATTYVAISTTTMSIHAIVPTYPTVSTNTTVPTWPPPSISPSQPRSTATPKSSPTSRTGNNDANRTHGFDPNAHRQENRDHYDNQKINGLTLPRSIRQSALTHRLGIEGCDPLSLPVTALMYQHTNNHWLRKLAHGREIYLIPTVDIAAVVFTTEPLTQLRNRGIDLDRVSPFQSTSRWESTGQDSKHKIRCSTDSRTDPKLASCPHNGSRLPTWDHPAQESIGWAPSTCRGGHRRHGHTSKARSIQHKPSCNNHSTCTHEQPQQSCSTIIWTSLPPDHSHHHQPLVGWPYAEHTGCPSLHKMAQKPSHFRCKTHGSHYQHRQNRDVVGTPTGWNPWNNRTGGSHDGHSSQPLRQELRIFQSASGHNSGHQYDQLTSSPASKKAQAQSASIPFANSPFDDSDHLHFNSLHHDFNGEFFSKFPHHQNANDGALRHPRPPTHSKVEINFGRMHQFNHIQPIFGDRHWLRTTFSPNNFSSPRVSIFVSPILWTCSPNSILGPQCITPWTANTVAPERFFNSATIG